MEYLGKRECPYTGAIIKLWRTNDRDWRGQDKLHYALYHNGNVIFEGGDFAGSPLHAIDSDATFATILTFLSMQPGDTDPEYFESYTGDQLNWIASYGEELSLYALELEGG